MPTALSALGKVFEHVSQIFMFLKIKFFVSNDKTRIITPGKAIFMPIPFPFMKIHKNIQIETFSAAQTDGARKLIIISRKIDVTMLPKMILGSFAAVVP